MKDPTINLRDLLFVVADPNSYLCMIVHSMLRSFGANKVHRGAELARGASRR